MKQQIETITQPITDTPVQNVTQKHQLIPSRSYESQQILFDHVFRAHNAKCMQSSLQLWCSEILTLLESKSTSQTSSGSLKLFLYGRKLAGTPMMNGVGARSSCKIKWNIIPINTCSRYIMFTTPLTRSQNYMHYSFKAGCLLGVYTTFLHGEQSNSVSYKCAYSMNNFHANSHK